MEALLTLIDQKVNAVRSQKRSWNPTLPRPEIHHDIHAIESLADRVKDTAANQTPARREVLSYIFAYTKLARQEKDSARGWTYVNLADSLLPLVADVSDLRTCMERFNSLDVALPAYLKKQLDPPLGNNYRYSERNRHDLHRIQVKRAFLWDRANTRIELKLRLWNQVLLYLIIGLIVLLVLCEGAIPDLAASYSLPLPFLCIAAFGLVGGGLSTYLKAPVDVSVTSHRLQRKQMLLRMLFGCAGSIVVLISFLGFGNEQIKKLILDNIYAFAGLGITAGFSERLFLDALNKMGENLNPSQTFITTPKTESTEGTNNKAAEQEETIRAAIDECWDEWKAKYPPLVAASIGKKLDHGSIVLPMSLVFHAQTMTNEQLNSMPKSLIYDGMEIPIQWEFVSPTPAHSNAQLNGGNGKASSDSTNSGTAVKTTPGEDSNNGVVTGKSNVPDKPGDKSKDNEDVSKKDQAGDKKGNEGENIVDTNGDVVVDASKAKKEGEVGSNAISSQPAKPVEGLEKNEGDKGENGSKKGTPPSDGK